jgi:hypothetical protein
MRGAAVKVFFATSSAKLFVAARRFVFMNIEAQLDERCASCYTGASTMESEMYDFLAVAEIWRAYFDGAISMVKRDRLLAPFRAALIASR